MFLEIQLAGGFENRFSETDTVFVAGTFVFTVKKGGKINLDFAKHIRGGKSAKNYRDNPEFVDSDGNILKDCDFSSPSTAAQFVTGRSTNGYEAWKVDAKKNLGDYMKEKGLR